jgi:hypothetical protein
LAPVAGFLALLLCGLMATDRSDETLCRELMDYTGPADACGDPSGRCPLQKHRRVAALERQLTVSVKSLTVSPLLNSEHTARILTAKVPATFGAPEITPA